MAMIVNTTDEEPMLAVVRFTTKLAWADADPEVAEPEVARLCLGAQEHVLANRWVGMASLMLTTADLLRNSSRVPDKDLECILSIICSLITRAGSKAEVLQIAENICSKLNHQPDDKPSLRLKVLFSLYNLLPSPHDKAFAYKKALELATAGKAADTSSLLLRTSTALSATGALAIWSSGSCSLLLQGSSKTRREHEQGVLQLSEQVPCHFQGIRRRH